MRLPSSWLTCRRMRMAVAVGLALAVMLCASTWPPRGDAARIQGRWTVVAVEDFRVPINEPILKTKQYLFEGRKMIVRARAEAALSWLEDWVGRTFKSPTFRLNQTAAPKEIDLFLPDFSTMRGIYDLDGDRLKICFSRPWSKAAMMRPAGLSVPGSGARLLLLQRDKK